MIKRFLTVIAVLVSAIGLHAQEWSATISSVDGLPGYSNYTEYGYYYSFQSGLFSPGVATDVIRLTVVETLSNEAANGDIYFALSELAVYDADGNKVEYTASSNADHNSLAGVPDGGGLAALCDNDITTYFHSYWEGNGVGEPHYLELALQTPVESFSLEWSTRLGQPSLMPMTVGVTLGADYASVGSGFSLGDAVTTVDDLDVANQFFVLKGNAADSYTLEGVTCLGNGPLYIRSAENGDAEPDMKHSMQLIPTGEGTYIVYWPVTGKFLKNSVGEYNGKNGWQESTLNVEEAAHVGITSIGDGNFELHYDAVYGDEEITLYIGAEARTDVSSKMKTFDLEHKQYLESGDYTKGYGLPMAFNWNIYKAELEQETVFEYMLTMSAIGQSMLYGMINDAYVYWGKYGNFNGLCNDEEMMLRDAIFEAEDLIYYNYDITFSQIVAAKSNLIAALSRYMAVKLDYYRSTVENILATVEFSEYPYRKDTYPSSSRSILENILNTVSVMKENIYSYSAAQYESAYVQMDSDIDYFYSTKVLEDTSSGTGGDDSVKEEIVESEYVYLYLANGGVEAYSLAALDGGYYTEGDRIYFPLLGGDVEYYTSEEYDSCSTVAPELPRMETFKFNNKYNPNLNVDAIADTVMNEMYFSLNAIGKWLTASFTLSDEHAIAYVDTVPQESKVTRQDFTNPVIYRVSRPDYNCVERVKVTVTSQGEQESTDAEVVEIPLSADNMYTNKPSQNADEGFESLLDGDSETIFHSTYGSANNATINVNTYITMELPYAVEKIKVYYKCRPQHNYNPKEWEIYASNDGEEWTLVRTLNYLSDDMPTGGSGQEYTSPAIDLGGSYSHIKILQTQGEYSKNHFAIAELRLYEVIENTAGDTGAGEEEVTYKNVRMPLGNEYKVNIDWLTDRIANVPRIDIDIEGGDFVTSKEYYLDANFRITGYGVYDDFEDSVQIKGRGNTSWGYSKKPYRLKFEEKVKPFGLTKGKSWVLLANAQKGSLMANAVAMKIGQLAGSQYANHIIPVELYMNGTYMGSYMFTEKVGMANNSVDVDEELGYLLELDTYYDETYKFTTYYYDLPVNVKEPDLTEYDMASAEIRLNNIQRDMDAMCGVLYSGGDIEEHLDMDAYARFYLANDLALNQEIGHPKSTFLFKENENDPTSKIKFGPIWDFDWGFGYENSSKYCYSGTTSSVVKASMEGYVFLQDIISTEAFKKHYYKVWKEFLEKNSIEELLEYIDSYYRFAEKSFRNNTTMWGSSYGFTASDRDRMKEWLQARKDYIYSTIDKVDIEDVLYTMNGDASCNNQLTIHDVALIVAYLNGVELETFSMDNADCNGSGNVESGDVTTAAYLVMDSKAPNAQYWSSTPMAFGEICSDEINFNLNEEKTVSLEMSSYTDELYNAFQFDVVVPSGVFITDIQGGASVEGYSFSYQRKSGDTYRVVAYSGESETFNTGMDEIARITFSNSSVIAEDNRNINIRNAYVVDGNHNELRLNDYSIRFEQYTGVADVAAGILVSGGECISITVLEPENVVIYGVDGRKIRTVSCKGGTVHVELPAGIYIVNGEKVTVK